MLRQIVLDTETTGLEPETGHRIIEIGCVELIDRRRTENNFHQFLNPEREIDEGAREVHGIGEEDLADKPRFTDIADDLLDYLRGAELIIHNADFDLAFLNAELSIAGFTLRIEEHCTVVDTLSLARRRHPGARNSLEALCRRYEVDDSQRTYHGALLDAQLLADVYLAMTGGQTSLIGDLVGSTAAAKSGERTRTSHQNRPVKVIRANEEELSAHRQMLERIHRDSDGQCLWLSLDPVDESH